MASKRLLNRRDVLRCGHGGRVNLPGGGPGERSVRMAELLEARISGCPNQGLGQAPCRRVVSILRGVDSELLDDGSPGLFRDFVALTDGMPSEGSQVRLREEGTPSPILSWPGAVPTAVEMVPAEALPGTREMAATGTDATDRAPRATFQEEAAPETPDLRRAGAAPRPGQVGASRNAGPASTGPRRKPRRGDDSEATPARSGSWHDDRPARRDALGIEDELELLAETFLRAELTPPLVAALLGPAGSGKSTALEVIADELGNRRSAAAPSDSPFVGHPYVIRYDAWAHAREDLGASLRRCLFESLNHQMAVEGSLFEAIRYAGLEPTAETPVWRVLDRGRSAFDELGDEALVKTAREALDDLDAGRRSSDPLWECLEERRRPERERLEQAREALAATKSRQEEARDELERQARATLELRARREAWKRLASEDEGPLGRELRRVDLDDVQDEAITKLSVTRIAGAMSLGARLLLGLGVPALLLLVGGLFALALPAAFGLPVPLAAVIGILLFAAAGVQTVRGLRAWEDERQELFERRVAAVRERLKPEGELVIGEIMRERRHLAGFEDVKGGTWTLEGVLHGLDDELESLRIEEERLRLRAGLTLRHRSLAEALREDEADDARAAIRVRDDLRELGEALVSASKRFFPRGLPRVVLLVDDLDRCPSERIVEFMDLAPLLLDHPLFVSVLALDAQSVSRALREVRGLTIGVAEERSRAMLSKLVQIPYGLRGVRSERLSALLVGEGKEPLGSWDRFKARQDHEADGATPAAPAPEELEAVRAVCASLELGPREAKRLANLYGLISVLWTRREGALPAFELRQAVILLLGLRALHARETRQLLDELARRFERENLGVSWKLQSALVRMCRRQQGVGAGATAWESLARHLRDKTLLSPDLTLRGFGRETTEVVRAFGFVEAAHESEPEVVEEGALEAEE